MTFEYKVVSAPTRGRKVKGVKTPADRFARALEDAINALAQDGWEYLRTDTLPSEERQGFTGRTTVYQNMLIFRRAIASPDSSAPALASVAAVAALENDPAPMHDRYIETVPGSDPVLEPAGEPTPSNSLGTMIANEVATARAPRLPSADAAQEAPGTPVKAPPINRGTDADNSGNHGGSGGGEVPNR